MPRRVKFQNAYDPTDEELRLWVLRGDNEQPVQDFDLMVAEPKRLELLIELVTEPTCRQKRFLLRCLYLLVGGSARSKLMPSERDFILEAAKRCEASGSDPLILLAERARALLDALETFDYQDWCDGRLARHSDLP